MLGVEFLRLSRFYWIDSEENVSMNGVLLGERYVTDKALGINDQAYPYPVLDKSIFVLGDQRSISVDSRSSEVGRISNDQATGRVIMRILPLIGLSWVS